MSGVFRLMHLRQLRRQPLRTVLAVIAIGAGVSLTVAVLIARSSLTSTFTAYSQSTAGAATLKVESRYNHGGIDASLVPAIEQVPGVAHAVPLVMTVTQVSDGHGNSVYVAAIGADCRAASLFGMNGCDAAAFSSTDTARPPLIGTAAKNAAGANGVLRTDVGDRSLSDAPVVAALDNINRGLVVVYPLPVAQAVFGRPAGLDTVYVVPSAGVSNDQLRTALQGVVGPANRVIDETRPDVVSYLLDQLLPFLFLISLFSLAIGAQLVYNTMSLSLEERRRELAIASALGGTTRTITGGVLTEAALLGLAGGLLGSGIGLLAAGPFVANLSHQAEQAAGVHLSVHPTISSTIIGLFIGVIASVLAAAVPARRAARLDIAGELVDRSRRAEAAPRFRARRAVVLAVVCAVGFVAAYVGSRNGGLEAWQPPLLMVGVICLFVAPFQFMAVIAPLAIDWLERRRVFPRGPARVAVANLSAESRRSSAVLLAVAGAVGMAFTIGGVGPGMTDAAGRFAAATAPDRVTVSTLDPNNTVAVDAKLAPDVQSALGHLPGVAAIDRQYWASFEHPTAGEIALDADELNPPRFHVYRGVDVVEALAHGQVMVGPGLARSLDLRPGSSFELAGRHGNVTLTVGGIWAAPDQLGRSIFLRHDQFDAIAGARPPTSVQLIPAPGVSTEQIATAVRDAHLGDNLNVWTTPQLATAFEHSIQGFLTPFWVLARGLLVVVFVATASTLLLAGVKRRREHGLLAAVGMPPGDLARMVLVEAGLFGLLGTVAGFLGGLVTLDAFSMSSATLTGLYTPFHLDLAPLLLYGSIATACVLAGAALPAWRTAQLDPVVALRYE